MKYGSISKTWAASARNGGRTTKKGVPDDVVPRV
jgi:hypothetical protein